MWLINRHFFLITFLCLACIAVNSQTLYWIGGSGNFNDPTHWSRVSGGSPAGVAPTALENAVFDDNSGEFSTVTLSSTVSVRSLAARNAHTGLEIQADRSSVLKCSGELTLSGPTQFGFEGTVILKSASNAMNTIHFGVGVLHCDIFFKEGNYLIAGIYQAPGRKISFEKGNYRFKFSSLTTDEMEVRGVTTTLRIDSSMFTIRKSLRIPDKSVVHTNFSHISAPFSDHHNVVVNPAINLGSGRVIDPGNTTLAIEQASVYATPSCSSCTGGFTLSIDPANSCASCTGRYFVVVASSDTSTPCYNTSVLLSTSLTVPAGIYTYSTACFCPINYNIFIYDSAGAANSDPNAYLTVNVLSGGSGTNFNFNPTTIGLNTLGTTRPSCFAACDGSLNLQISGGASPYSVSVNPPALPTTTANNSPFTKGPLCGGTYTFSITDFNGCSAAVTKTLTPPTQLAPNLVTQSISCNGQCNGSFTVFPNNSGTAPYSATVSSLGTFSLASTASKTLGGLCAVPITGTLTDAKGCSVTINSSISQPPALAVTATQTNVSCGGLCNGAASVAVSGGISAFPYTYSWSPGTSTNAGITGLCAANYSVIVKDNNGCNYTPTPTFTITQPPPITISQTVTNVSCHGLSNASVVATTTGGIATINYTWMAAGNTIVSLTSSLNSVPVGSYTLYASDGSCTVSRSVTISEPPSLTITASTQSVGCIGGCTGSATVNVSGGSGGPFTYTWNTTTPTQTGQVASGLCVGSYTALVRDAAGCPISTVVSISQPNAITPAVTSKSLNCNGVCTGSIGASPSGGIAPYHYTLTSSSGTVASSAPSFTGLCGGSYTLSISDAASSCGQNFVVQINEPAAIVPSINTTSITCYNACNGVLAGSAIGGVPGYTYTWATSASTVAGSTLSNRCVGNYTLSVKDSHGCVKSATTALVQPPDIAFTVTPVNASCFGNCNGVLSASVTGGTPGYTLNWSNGTVGTPNASLCAGSYTLNIVDQNGCTKTGTAAITTPAAIVLTKTVVPTSCALSCDGTASIIASGGVPSFTYAFNSSPVVTNTTGLIGALCAGNYIASVSDANGCAQSIPFSVTSPAALSAAITGTHSSCINCTGAATVTPSNGLPGYSYVWTNSLSTTVSTLSTAASLCSGAYSVLVTDAKNCTATATVNILQTLFSAPVSGGTGIQCFGACTASAVVNPTGGNAPYSFTWTPTGQTTQTATSLCAGSYTVFVKEGGTSGCVSSSTINITSPPALTVVASKNDITCAGACNGVISATASGGTGALTYLWGLEGETGSSVSHLCPGVYSLQVSDANGCLSAMQIFTITEPPPIAATYTTTAPSNCSLSDGNICASATGGSGGPYTYTWLPSASNASCLTGLSAGAYSVVISDGIANCSTTLSTLLNSLTGPTLTTVGYESVTCFGGSDGSATVSATGSMPLTFSWTPSFVTSVNTATNTTATGLSTGTYVLSSGDVNGCVTSIAVPIVQASSLTLNAVVTNPKCNNGVCNGSITVASPSGGTPSYSYQWSPGGATTQNLTNICAGSYSLTVTDGHACQTQYTYSVSAPALFTISAIAGNIPCSGACNGSVVANASGGAAPVSYTWSPLGSFTGSTTATVLNLCAGVYTVNAVDGNGCYATGTNTYQVSEPVPLTLTLNLQNASCSNSCNAVATETAAGGTAPYTFGWSTGTGTTNIAGGLCAGNYTGTITDANGCSIAKGFTVVPPAVFSATVVPSNPKCNPLSNPVCSGSISTSFSGAHGTVSYSWFPTGASQNPTNLCSGVYTLTAVDANSCAVSQIATLVDPPALISNATYSNPTCHGACNGTAVITPTNAVGAVSVTWTPSAPNSPTVTGLCAGLYTVNIADANGCLDVQTYTLVDPPAIVVNTSNSGASCSQSNGSITAVATGGSPGASGYSYIWSPPAVSTSSFVTNLPAGVYTLQVSDGLCTNTVVIPLSNANGPTSAPIVSSSIACNSQCTGAASIDPVSIAGGTPGYTITWLAPPASSSVNPLTNLCAGIYTAKINDANNCLLFNSVTIAEPNAISVLPALSYPTCFGVCNGAISLATSGGDGNYTYSWTPAVSSSSDLANACPGNYTVAIAYGGTSNCTAPPQIFSLPAATDIQITTAVTPNPCFGNCAGTASVTSATGVGSALFTYGWSDGQSGQVASNLCNGIYSVTATAPSGCSNLFTVSITSPAAITSTLAVTQPSCNQCNGAATITASGGAGSAYNYNWNSDASGPSSSNLCAGVYQVIITDLTSHCQQTETVVINNSNGITGETFNTQNISCAGYCNGSSTVTAVGGNAPISYQWLSPVVNGAATDNLCAGTYYVQMSDVQGCVRTSSVAITAPGAFTVTQFIHQPGCTPVTTGSINVMIAGGTPAYSYSWQPTGATTSSLTNLNVGQYTLTITDSSPAHCSQTQVFDVSNLNGPVITYTQTDVSCFGYCNGAITAAASGTGISTFNWSNGSTAQSVTNLCAGLITLTVTAPNGCSTVKTFTIDENPQLMVNAPQVTQPSCNLCNGGATVTPFGGISPYTYTWSNNATTPGISGLCAGLYQIKVTDAASCSQTFTFTVNNTGGITGENFNVQNISCGGNCNGSATVAAIGGSAPISYQWISPSTSGPVLGNLCAGDYFVQMTDAQNCIRTASVDISIAAGLSVSGSVISPTCNGTNGSIGLTISGGTPTYAVSWFPGGSSSSTLSGIGAGSYTVTVHDSPPGTCTVTQSFNVSNPTGPFIIATQTNISCFGACTGVISVTASSGGNTNGLACQWSNGATGSTVSGLCQGIITLTVTDTNTGCVAIESYTITQNPDIFINMPSVSQPSCGQCNGTASISVFGGTAPYQFTWSNSASTPVISNLCAGIYQVQVTDALQCQKTLNVLVNNSSGITGENFSAQNIICGGTCNGGATVTAIGGSAPISYQWINPSVSGPVINNLCAGDYFVQMTDAQNCIRTASVDISSAISLSVSGSVISPVCNSTNGVINLTIGGGTPAYVVSWFPGGSSSPTLSGIGAGSYTVTVHDSPPGTCTVTQSFNISNVTGPLVVASQTNINCYGACTGVVSASASVGGSTATLVFNWSNGATGTMVTGLCQGVITLTVTDTNTGCVSIRSYTIIQNSDIAINAPSVTQPSCGQCNGTASITVFGGTAPYHFAWTNNATTPAISDLCAGIYQVQVTDALQCQKTHNVLINNSSGITGENINIQNIQCANACNGGATVTAVGGTQPVNYSWINPAANTQTISNLCAGNYFVQMSDAAGCIRNASVAIQPASDFTVSTSVTAPICGVTPPNGMIVVSATGGSGSFQYSWTPGGSSGTTLNNLAAGNYSVTVTDATSGCTHDASVSLSNPTGPVLTFTKTDVDCYNACTGSIIVVSTATHALTFVWSTGNAVSTADSSVVTGLCRGAVTLTVTDNITGCQSVNSFNLNDNSRINVSIPAITQPSCHNSCDGAVTLLPTGGSFPYMTYSWLPGNGGSNPMTGLCAGDSAAKIYTVVVSDSKGCTSATTVQLNNPPDMIVSYSVTNSSCSTIPDGSIAISPSGGTPSYTPVWTGPGAFTATNATISHIYAGTYSLHILDQKGCTKDTTLKLASTVSVQAMAGLDPTVCPTASIVLSGTNSSGSTNITFNWFLEPDNQTAVSTDDSVFVPSAGSSTYVLQVNSTVTGCFDRDTIIINLLPAPVVDAGPTFTIPLYSTVTIGGNPTAFGDVSFSWQPANMLNDPSLPNPVASNTIDADYTVTVTDNGTGCSASDQTSVYLYPAIIVSNGFSPNGDGKNDRWIIDNIQQFGDCTVEIFNRWGDQLFYSKGYETPFDGRYHNRDLPVGTYYYVINLNHPAYPKAFTGPLTIFR